MEWDNTSIIAGQDTLFFAPLSPTLAFLACDSGAFLLRQFVGWTPQIRVEHRIALTDHSKLLLQAGILDPVTGTPPFSQQREPNRRRAEWPAGLRRARRVEP